jgi:hypothetical protein
MSDYYASYNDPATAKSIAEKYGFCLVKGVFGPEEMINLERDLAMAHAEFGGQVPDLYSTPSLQWLMFDERVRRLAHALLGDTLVYYRETNLAYEKVPGRLTAKPFTDYHCDARGSGQHLYDRPAHRGVYPAYRFGIYFRNYRLNSGGLKVAPGSHLREYMDDRQWALEEKLKELPRVPIHVGRHNTAVTLQPMELYNVASEPGDIVIFSLRCFHAAGAVRLKDRPTLALLPRVEAEFPAQFCLPTAPGSRNAIFFDYGAPHAALDYYVKWRAVVSPARPDVTYKYGMKTPEWLHIRNDRIIVMLAQRLLGGGPSAKQDAMDLVTLSRSHIEFAPEHALFDRTQFEANLVREPSGVVLNLAHDIVARQQLHIENEARRKAE